MLLCARFFKMITIKIKKSQLKVQVHKNHLRFLVPQFSKGQLKIQEMAFMLMAVVILFVLAGLFFIIIEYKSLYKEAGQTEKEKAISTIAKLADTAEFTCGKSLCIDTDKLVVMKERKVYNGFWPVTSLSIVKLFQKQDAVECSEKNYPNCSFFKVYDSKKANVETVSTFVSLCRKEQEKGYWYDKCELGKIVAGIEPKQAGAEK